MYRKQILRRRAALLTLVIGSLVLLSTHFSEGSNGPLHRAQSGITSALAPAGSLLDRALKPARDLIDWFDETFEARGENEALRGELNEIRDRLVKLSGAAAENTRLKKLLDFNQDLLSYAPVAARVIGRSPTLWYSTLTLDVGRGDGVAENDPVIDGDGLVGTVSRVTGNTAVVRLLSDHRSAISARLLPDGPSGVIKAKVGEPGQLLLDFIEDESAIKRDRIVVTAGWTDGALASRFPPGLRIGRISNLGPPAAETFARVEVEPFADLGRVDTVEVLVMGEGG